MDFKRIQKWDNELNICIRCGYCFEQCHLFKITGWETDAPRGKLILIYGMLHGETKPSEYIANKFFECFYCKRCDNSCSAGVSITDIFTDVRADFVDAGFDVDGTTSKTNDDLCSRCGICVSVCKHEARSLDKENKKIVIDKVKCQSCGCCEAACPSGAAYIVEGWELGENELREKVINFLKEDNNEPKISNILL